MRMNLSLLSVALLLVCVSSATAAEVAGDVNATQEARNRFRRGVQLYNEGSFEAALAEFNKAYQLSPNYRLLYNIAQTQFDLHDYVGASKNLEQYSREGGGEISEERRGQVADLNRKLEERIGQVEVTCNLDGAEIRIDDLPVGTSPLRSAVPVNAGPRRIMAIKPGHPTVMQLVTISGMEKKAVSLELAQAKREDLAAASGAAAAANWDQNAGIVREREPDRKKSSRAGLVTSMAIAGGCAVATGVFGLLTLQAKNDFDRELKAVPTTKDKIADARSKMKTYALATDILGGATVLSLGAAVIFFLTGDSESDAPRSSLSKPSVAVAPTAGGLVLHGVW